ncbi:chemokine (C-C motif) ligand 34a, duplicate 3 [Brachyhypopomus gauderio]|uniref:chemokine (C-C motif) ligand 34a, duplicate 3 n=1 Tax=Brachyhypopomus gauderio TaxID=698409 RepID=UPI0040431C12
MHLSLTRTGNLALLAVIVGLSVMWAGAQPINPNCCTEVSTQEITIPITGFKLQKARLPCVNAVIFFTKEGIKCSHWKETWVRQKINELRKIQKAQIGQSMNTTAATTTDY